MTRPINRATAMTVSVVALLVGLAGGWYFGRAEANREVLSLALAHELEVSGLCANGLRLELIEQSDSVVMLLERRLAEAVANANQLIDEGARFDPTEAPNLADSVRRAADYYGARNDAPRKQIADALSARLGTRRSSSDH